jgi:hypothetical protein
MSLSAKPHTLETFSFGTSCASMVVRSDQLLPTNVNDSKMAIMTSDRAFSEAMSYYELCCISLIK